MFKILMFLMILFAFPLQDVQAITWGCDEETAEVARNLETKYSECKATILECKEKGEKLRTELREVTDKFHQKDKELTACQSDKGGAAAITAKMDAIQKRELELARWEKELQNQKESYQAIEKAVAEKQESFFTQQAELMKKVGKAELLEMSNRQLQEYNRHLSIRFWINLVLLIILIVVVLILLLMMRRQSNTLDTHIISNARVIDIIKSTDIVPKEQRNPPEDNSK